MGFFSGTPTDPSFTPLSLKKHKCFHKSLPLGSGIRHTFLLPLLLRALRAFFQSPAPVLAGAGHLEQKTVHFGRPRFVLQNCLTTLSAFGLGQIHPDTHRVRKPQHLCSVAPRAVVVPTCGMQFFKRFLKRPDSRQFPATRFQLPNLKSWLAQSAVRT